MSSLPSPPAFVCDQVSLPGRLTNLSLRIESDSQVLLLGKNGAGKSSLLALLAGLVTPTQGEVSVLGKPLAQLSYLERAALVAWLPQRAPLDPNLRVLDLLEGARFRFFRSRQSPQRSPFAYLEEVGILELAERRISELSGGEVQRAQLAALLAQESPLLLVDEPGNHLDPHGQILTYQLLARVRRETGRTLIVACHDIRMGQILTHESGTPTRILGLEGGALQMDSLQAGERPDLKTQLSELYGVPYRGGSETEPLELDLKAALAQTPSVRDSKEDA